MLTQVTKGVKVSVCSDFEGTLFKNRKTYYSFGYTVIIENLNNDTIQIMARQWNIFDALNAMEMISGKDILGRVPTLKSGENYTYQSGCMLAAPIGAVQGHYQVANLDHVKAFKVEVPTFKLAAPFAIN